VSFVLILFCCCSTSLALLPVWHTHEPVNTGPVDVGGHSLVYHDNKLIVSLGWHEDFVGQVYTFFNNNWEFNLLTNRWRALATGPSARTLHAFGIDRENADLYIFGGFTIDFNFSNTNIFSDFWVYHINTDHFQQIHAIGAAPGPHAVTNGVFINGHFWLFGGIINGDFDVTNDLWKYSPATNRWTEVRPNNDPHGPVGRLSFYMSAIRVGDIDTIFIVEGETGGGTIDLRDSWAFEIQNDRFRNITLPDDMSLHGNRTLSSGNMIGFVEVGGINHYVIYGGEEPGGNSGCGTPFPTNPQNSTWLMNVHTAAWHEQLVVGSRPAGKRIGGDTNGNVLYTFGGWFFDCVDNVGPGTVYPPQVFSLHFFP